MGTNLAEHYDRRVTYVSALGRSHSLREILPKWLTLLWEPGFYVHLWDWVPTSYRTMFEEVAILPGRMTWSPAVEELAMASSVLRELSFEQFAEVYFQALCDAIERAWIPERFHFVLHSAGHDSRFMSWAIKTLHEQNGDDWLGDVLFMEADNEATEFKELMAIQGWGESLYSVYNEGALPDEYHAASLNFQWAYEWMSGGMRPYPINLHWTPLEWAKERGLVSDSPQCWSAFGANFVTKACLSGDLAYVLGSGPHSAQAAMESLGDWVIPYDDLELVRTVRENSGGREAERLVARVIDYLSPEMAEVTNPVDVRYKGLSDSLFENAVADYQESWYGQIRSDVVPVQTMDYCTWWGHWGLASLCEHLLANGHVIEPPCADEDEEALAELKELEAELGIVEQLVEVSSSVPTPLAEAPMSSHRGGRPCRQGRVDPRRLKQQQERGV